MREEQLSNIRANFVARNLVFWAGNRSRKGRGMFITPAQIWWAPIEPYFTYTANKVNEEVVREVSKIFIDRISGTDLAAFQVGSVVRTLMFLKWDEQCAVLQILRNHYGKPQSHEHGTACKCT